MENKNNTFEEIWNALKKSKKILLSLHPKPDGDSLGSCTALKYVLERRGKSVTLISQDELDENLMDFSFSKEVKFGKKLTDYNLNNFDLLIFIDHGTLEKHPQEIVFMNFPKNLNVINIDHHHTNKYYGNLNYVDSRVVSSCSILTDFFGKAKINFDRELTRRLLLGILTDSGFFLNDHTPDSIKKAAFLIETGEIDYQKEFYGPIMNLSWKVKKLVGELTNNMKKEKIFGKNVAYSYILASDIKKLKLNSAEIRLGINFLKDIKDVDVIFTLSEMEKDIKGSFRSRGVDTTLFSKEFGGGGHKEASAFYIKKMPIREAIKKVLEAIKRVGIQSA